jgi:lipopolysaccharide/colanic/teichoic acid biosynthesis glycosyltransferase
MNVDQQFRRAWRERAQAIKAIEALSQRPDAQPSSSLGSGGSLANDGDASSSDMDGRTASPSSTPRGIRALDLTMIACSLVFLLPLVAGIALLVLFIDGSPILYGGPRVGREGEVFTIWKFRSMRPGSDESGSVTTAEDGRVTRAGAILRRLKLDELPQLWNVVRGQMSLVGPRPETSEYVDHMDLDSRALLLSTRPGITDPASIVFSDEARLLPPSVAGRAYSQVVRPAKTRISCRYLQSRTVWTDVLVMSVTLKTLMLGHGE